MKIACFQNLPACGAKRALYNFALELHHKGHKIDFYTFDAFSDKHMNIADFADQAFIYPLIKFRKVFNITPYFLGIYWNAFRKSWYFNYLNKQYQKIAKDIDSRGYDLVFVHNCYYTQAPFLLRHLKTASVYYAHEPLRSIYDPVVVNLNNQSEKNPMSFLKRILSGLSRSGMMLEKKILKDADRKNFLSADHVLTNSFFTKDCLLKAYGVKSEVCYPGVDLNAFKPLNIPKQNYVITVGGVEALKQHDFVIRSLARIPEIKRPHLVIVGPWSVETYVEQITELAERLKVKFAIKKLVTDADLLKIYNEAQMLIYPPLMEPLGLVPLEAMACKTPVIGVKEGGIKETVIDGETGFLINRDEDECAQAILKILDDKATAERMAVQAREYVNRKWNWAKCTERLEEVFKSLLERES